MYRSVSRWLAGGTSVSTSTWPRAGWKRTERLTNLGFLDRLQHVARLDVGDRAQGEAGVAPVLLELALEFPLDIAPVLGRDPAPLDEQLGQRPLEPHRPAGADVGKLGLVDQVVLERDDGEEQVAIDVDIEGHGSDLSRSTCILSSRTGSNCGGGALRHSTARPKRDRVGKS